jgi:hypothetical protein
MEVHSVSVPAVDCWQFLSFNFKTQEPKSLVAAGKIPVRIEVVFIASGLPVLCCRRSVMLHILILPSESNNIRGKISNLVLESSHLY